MPPLVPARDNDVDWNMAEEVFGVRFPTDFKELVHTYGSVYWCDLFGLFYPDTSTREKCEESRRYVQQTLDMLLSGSLRDESNEQIEPEKYQEPQSLLLCLSTTNGTYVCWHTVGEPDDWKVVEWDEGTIRSWDCNLTQLIANWISQTPPYDEVWPDFFLSPEKFWIR